MLALFALSNAIALSKRLSSWNCLGRTPTFSLLAVSRISDNAYSIYSHENCSYNTLICHSRAFQSNGATTEMLHCLSCALVSAFYLAFFKRLSVKPGIPQFWPSGTGFVMPSPFPLSIPDLLSRRLGSVNGKHVDKGSEKPINRNSRMARVLLL